MIWITLFILSKQFCTFNRWHIRIYILGPSPGLCENRQPQIEGRGAEVHESYHIFSFSMSIKMKVFIASFCFSLDDYIEVFIACTSIIASESDKQKQNYKKESNELWPRLKFFPHAFSSAIILRQANMSKASYQWTSSRSSLSPSLSLTQHPTCTSSLLISFRSFQEILITKNLGFLDLMPFMVWMIPFGSILVQKVSTTARLVLFVARISFSMSAFFIQNASPFPLYLLEFHLDFKALLKVRGLPGGFVNGLSPWGLFSRPGHIVQFY